MKITQLVAILSLVVSCGGKSKPPKNDDIVGGEEKLFESMSCVATVPSLNKDGEHDAVRGFSLNLIGFIYDGGSVALSLVQKYTFNQDGKSFSETASRVFAQNAVDHEIETDLLLAKVFVKTKEVKVFKKYRIGETFTMECK